MQLRMGLVALLLAALTGCGGGGGDSAPPPFVIWAGNSNGDHVVDANNHAFGFFADNGCLFNFQTGRENPLFCLTSAGDTALYGGLRVRIVNIRSVTGVCIAALIDEVTAHFIAIELDSFGNEVVFITDLHPDFCIV
jgi:hypothetical protein